MEDDYTKTISIDDITFLRKKFKLSRLKIAFFIVFISATLILVTIGAIKITNGKKEAEKFNPVYDQTSKVVYLDVKELSGWILESIPNETYYAAAVDEDHYYYLVYLGTDDYTLLNEQYEYFEELSDKIPDVKRVYGRTFLITDNIINGFIKNDAIKNKDDFHYYYGDYGINFTVSNPIDAGNDLFLFSILTLIVASVIGISLDIERSNFNKSLKGLNDNDIFLAANELLESRCEKGMVLTENFLFDFKKKIIIKFSNVIWSYDSNKTTIMPLFIFIRIVNTRVLSIYTKTIKNYQCDFGYKEYVDAKTNGCLKGNSRENYKLYKDIKNNVIPFDRVEVIEEEKPIIDRKNISFDNHQTTSDDPKIIIVEKPVVKKNGFKRAIEIVLIIFGILFVLLIASIYIFDDDEKPRVEYAVEKFCIGEVVKKGYGSELDNLISENRNIYTVADNLLANQEYLENFNSSDYYLELSVNEEHMVVLYFGYDTDQEYILYSDVEEGGAKVETNWHDWNETGEYIGLSITPARKGYSIVTVTNNYNDDVIKIFVYCK